MPPSAATSPTPPSPPPSLAEFTRAGIARRLAFLSTLPEGQLWRGAPPPVRDRIASDEAAVSANAKYLAKWSSPGMLESNAGGLAALARFQEDYRQRVEGVAAMKGEWEGKIGEEIGSLRRDLDEWA